MTGENLPSSEAAAGLTRRSVVRTAGHAAWVAPVIVVASTAPAFAVSGAAAVTATPSGARSSADLAVTVAFSNTNTGATGLTDLSVTVSPTGTSGVVDAVPTGVASDAGFTYLSKSRNATTGAQTFVFRSATGIPGAATGTSPAKTSVLTFHAALTLATPETLTHGTLSVTATPAAGMVTGVPGTY